MDANELLELIEEIETEEEDVFTDEVEVEEEDEVVVEEENDGVNEKYVVRGGKKVLLTPLEARRLAIRRQLRSAGKVRAGQKLLFKKDSASYIVKAMTGQEKTNAIKRARLAHRGSANAKRNRSLKIARTMN